MSQVGVTADEVEQYKSYIGRSHEDMDTVERQVGRRLAATLDASIPGDTLPAMWHYGLFLTAAGTSTLDVDGHPRRGGFLPPVRLPRRMFAGATLDFVRPLVIGQPVSRQSRIASVDHRRGKTGDLVFVRVAIILSQNGIACIGEEQTIVYRSAGLEKIPAVKVLPRAPLGAGERSENWTPTPTELFRYSASTFNTHRIHYDRPYTTDAEGYPDLVVHGPLTATRLCRFAEKLAGRRLSGFTFRGEAPAFCGQEIRLVGIQVEDTFVVRAERADGVVAMSATALLDQR
jgi:3-methylfumaryl-CoA hydratase